MIREAFKDLARLRQIAAAVARHGFGEVLARSQMAPHAPGDAVSNEEMKKQSTARRFRMLLGELGPTFVKLGQTLSTRPDLLPAALVDELAQLQDNVPPVSIEEVYAQLEASLGKPVHELFREIHPVPLASASIAQVHLATTLDGDAVVVKVQRPHLTENIRADIDLLYYLARALEALFEEAGIYAPRGIVEEFERTLAEELDFGHEAENLKAFAVTHADRPYLKVPRLYESLSSREILTMERLHGAKITEADYTQHDRGAVTQHLVESAFRQLFEDGLFHGDPHPGNVLVLEGPGNIIGLLDFGLVGRVNKAMQESIITLVMSVALRDADTASRLLYRLGSGERRGSLQNFRNDIDSILSKYLDKATLKEISADSLMRDLLDLAVRYRIRVPKEYAVLARASILVEGIIRKVHPELNVLELAKPFTTQLLSDRINPGDWQGNAMKVALRLQTFATEVPLQLSQILLDLETGKLSVNVKSEGLDQLNTNIRTLTVTLYLGLLSASFVIGMFISFAGVDRTVGGVPLTGLVALVFAGALFGVATSWAVFSGRVGKIKLSRWLKKPPPPPR
jgi:ubiquinone biosynthesis protein